MELKLLQTTTIKELKKQFSRIFPFLRLEFFQPAHSRKEDASRQNTIADEIRLSDVQTFKKQGIFSFGVATPVMDFEQQLQRDFGLLVQVYRKASELWIQTTDTDQLSLGMQNKMGEVAGRPMTINLHSLFL